MFTVTTASETRHKRIGWIITILLHLCLLILLWWYKVWPFDPPMESLYGIQVNFGTSQTGTGEVQNAPTEARPESQATEPAQSSEAEQVEETESPSEPTETYETETPVTNTTEQQVTGETDEAETVTEEETTEEQTETSETSETGESESETEETSSEQSTEGNDLFEGDKGSKEGDINESDIYEGSSTGEGGFNSQISGWAPDRIPRPEDESSESGKIVFKVKIDQDGEIVSVNILESSVSSRVALIYQREVEKLSFHTTSNNPNPAPFSTGTVSFIIKAR